MSIRAFVYTPIYRQLDRAMASWQKALAYWRQADPGVAIDHYLAYGDNESADGHDNVVRKYRRAQQVFLAGDWDVFISLEDDIIIPEDAFPRLMRVLQLGADIAYGLYVFRHKSQRWSAYTSLSELGGQSYSMNPDFARLAWGQVRDVYGVGNGLTAYRRHVMVKLPFRRGGKACNDWYISADAQRVGYLQRCDFGLICGHIGADKGEIYWPDVETDDLYRVEKLGEAVECES